MIVNIIDHITIIFIIVTIVIINVFVMFSSLPHCFRHAHNRQINSLYQVSTLIIIIDNNNNLLIASMSSIINVKFPLFLIGEQLHF